MLHLAMVRSPFAHANIVSIDTSAAKAATNVVAVLTGKDLGEEQGVNANAWPITTEQVTPNHQPMPPERVAFAGEIVAVVVARTAAEARDAAELVDVEYDELPAALDLRESAEDKVLAHPELGTNKTAFWQLDSAAQGTGGDVEEAIAEARANGIVIEREHPPAAADPGVHGAPVDGGRPDRRADHHVVGDPDPPHHPLPARGHDRRTGVEDPGHRA